MKAGSDDVRVPLAVDLDGTLIRTDLLWESFLVVMRREPWTLLRAPFWWACGRARLKQELGRRATLDPASLPEAPAEPNRLAIAGIGTIMGLVAKRNGLNVDGVSAHVTKEMAAAPVRRIGKLLCVVTVPNSAGISAEDRTKLEKGALACPVAQSLHPDTQVQIEFRYI